MIPARPAPLSRGARLALIATGGPITQARLDPAIAHIERAGFQVVQRRDLGPSSDSHPYLAGPDATRLDDLVWALSSPNIDAVLCARGGYGTMRLLPPLRRALSPLGPLPPRPVIGYSDITALHAFCQHTLGWASLHAPMAFSFTPDDGADHLSPDQLTSWDHLLHALTQTHTPPAPCAPRLLPPPAPIHGALAGGNLAVLDAVYRSPSLPSLKDTLLVLEDVDEAPYRLDRMITSLHLRGASQEVRAVALGRFTDCGPLSSSDAVDHALSLLKDWNVPVFSGLDVGHVTLQRSLWMGRPASLHPSLGLLSDLDPS